MPKVTLAAALIVKDEEDNLPGCLESLEGLVDEIVVYDTGSGDATVAIARAAGARVQEGYWDGDFARARNAAMAMTSATWVLAIDADERADADPRRLRALLAASTRTVDVFSVRIFNHRTAGAGAGHEHPAPRLLRRAIVRYSGRLHEQAVRRDRVPGRMAECPREALRLDHYGYADQARLRSKAVRNNAIAQGSLDAIVDGASTASPMEVAVLLLNVGRSRRAAGDRQGAVDALETLRQVAPGSRPAIEGTAVLAEMLLDAGMAEQALLLADDLVVAGVDVPYCDWLRVRACMQLGRWEEALTAVRGIETLRDPAGRVLGMAEVREAHMHVAIRLRLQDEAVAALLQAMVRHGSINGRSALLLRLWGSRPPGQLADLLVGFALPEHLEPALAELRACPEPGPALAGLVCALTGVRA